MNSIVKSGQHRARYLVSLAFNHAEEAGVLPEPGPSTRVLIVGLGASLRAVFKGWYCDAAVIDVVYDDEHVAVGWLRRSRGQVRLADFYSTSRAIFQAPLGRDTELLGRTSKPRAAGIVQYLRQPPEVYCVSNTPCL